MVQHRSNFNSDHDFINQLKHLAKFSYADTSSLLDREINHCQNIFYIEDQSGELVCFAMYNFELLEDLETVYYGLTVCAESHKSSGLAKLLWTKIADEILKRQLEKNISILCWLTTPTPIVFYWFTRFLQDSEPYLDGSYSANGKQLAQRFKRVKYPLVQTLDDNPFILRNVASNTLYSSAEQQRMKDAAKKLNITAFEKDGVDETKGDRFLIIGFIPTNDQKD